MRGRKTPYRDLITLEDGQQALYYATPIAANAGSCLRCHSDPALAPATTAAITPASAPNPEATPKASASGKATSADTIAAVRLARPCCGHQLSNACREITPYSPNQKTPPDTAGGYLGAISLKIRLRLLSGCGVRHRQT